MTRIVCRACGSGRIIPDAQPLDHDGTTRQPLLVAAPVANPSTGLLGLAATSSPTRARVCGDCGLVELYAVDTARMWAEHTGA
ncbi:MAG: hypothetical protein EAS51_13355 [Microbacteriaceae bacterium]|nr:MAG: hypothetical protein EAS51_13355 [Microbacteriaceae bacterium]